MRFETVSDIFTSGEGTHSAPFADGHSDPVFPDAAPLRFGSGPVVADSSFMLDVSPSEGIDYEDDVESSLPFGTSIPFTVSFLRTTALREGWGDTESDVRLVSADDSLCDETLFRRDSNTPFLGRA